MSDKNSEYFPNKCVLKSIKFERGHTCYCLCKVLLIYGRSSLMEGHNGKPRHLQLIIIAINSDTNRIRLTYLTTEESITNKSIQLLITQKQLDLLQYHLLQSNISNPKIKLNFQMKISTEIIFVVLRAKLSNIIIHLLNVRVILL